MESLSNFNFLKVNEIKKSNESKSNNKKLLDNENAFVTGKDEGIGNKIKNLLNDVELNKKLNAENSSSEKQTNKKSHKNKNVELPEASLVDASVKVLENENTNNLENITVEKQKGKKSFLNLAKGNSLNIDISNKEEKILDQNTNKVFNARSVVNELDNKIFNKIQPNLLVAKTNKYKTEAQNILNNNKKSKIKSFFQNYFNYKLKKYTKKNISLKKSNLSNFVNYKNIDFIDNKNAISNNNFKFKVNNAINEKKNSINSENNTRDQFVHSENNTKITIEKDVSKVQEKTFDNFDRLKNILDIRSNDIKQRFSQILENNIRMNNNKFEIQLRPENLGKIQITLEISGHNVDININSDNINAIQSLTENNSNLQKMLQNHGMNLNNFNFNGNNNKGFSKNSKKNEEIKSENVSVNTTESRDNKDDDSIVSNKLVYAKA